EHLGRCDGLDRRMCHVFAVSCGKSHFCASVPDILRTTQLPLPPQTAKNSLKQGARSAFYANPRHDTSYWAEKTAGFNFDRADQVDAAKYNLIQWQGLVGEDVPYPAVRDGRDLSKHRKALLKQWRESRLAAFTKQQATLHAGGGK